MAVTTALERKCVRCHEIMILDEDDMKVGKIIVCPICSKKQRVVMTGIFNRKIELEGVLFG